MTRISIQTARGDHCIIRVTRTRVNHRDSHLQNNLKLFQLTLQVYNAKVEEIQLLLRSKLYKFRIMSQCLSGSGCSKDQENYDWTTAELISQLFIEVTSTAHSLYRNSVQTCRWFTKIKTASTVLKPMKENPCIITTFNLIGNDWSHCQLLEMHKMWNLSVNTMNVWHSSYSWCNEPIFMTYY